MNDILRHHIDAIKSQLDLREYATRHLGLPLDQDKINCIFGHSDSDPSLHIYADGFFCFACREHGDFIALHQAVSPDATFLDAIDEGGSFVGLGPAPREGWTEEQMTSYRKERDEVKTLCDLNREAAEFYHSNLGAHADSIYEQWGLTGEFLEKKLVGFAPPERGSLMRHLTSNGFDVETCKKSGLFHVHDGKFTEVFRGRIVYPYWHSNRIHYFIGRRTDQTPKMPKKEHGEIVDWKEAPKYKKMLVHGSGKNEHVSKHVKNILYGLDYLTDPRYDYIIITEGIADAMAAEQAGFPVCSPVTTRLKKADFEERIDDFKRKRCVYIINDSEESHQGEQGALDIADMLGGEGVQAKIGEIDRPEGVDKVDLADAARDSDNPAVLIQDLLKKAKPALLHRLMSIDPELDELERMDQLLSFEAAWRAVPPAQLSVYVDKVGDHFGLKYNHKKELLSALKKIQKDNKDDGNKKATPPPNLSLKDLVYFEIESEGGSITSVEKIAQMIIQHIQKDGAKFYSMKMEDSSLVYYRNRLLHDRSPEWLELMHDIAGLNPEFRTCKAILKSIHMWIKRNGSHIKALSWISTTQNNVKYYNLSGEAGDELVCLDPTLKKIIVVPNGNNEDSVALKGPSHMHKLKLDKDCTVEEGLRLYKKLIFDNMSCRVQDRYLVASWQMLSWFVDQLETRPIMRFHGDAGSGKTTAAKMMSALMYGEVRHENASTTAAIYDSGSMTPCLYLDNIENHNMNEALTGFMVATATGAIRQKKGSSGVGDIVQQAPQCTILSTGVEPIRKNELIQRTFLVDFSKDFHNEKGLIEGQAIRKIVANRNKMLTAFLKIAHIVHQQASNEEYYSTLVEEMARRFPENSKSRSLNAQCYILLALEVICKYMKEDYDFAVIDGDMGYDFKQVRFDFNEDVHWDVFESFVHGQNVSDTEAKTGDNEPLYCFEQLQNQWDVIGADHDDHDGRGRVQRFKEMFGVEFREHRGKMYMLASWSQLHYAFTKLHKNYSFQTPSHLMSRIRDSRKILRDAGWFVGNYAYRDSKTRYQIITWDQGKDTLSILADRYPDTKWIHQTTIVQLLNEG